MIESRRHKEPNGTSAEPLLRVEHLSVRFTNRHGTLTAIDDISFSIAAGEILGVVGESGAGKSLTGSAIIGLLDPPGRVTDGRVLFEGQRIDDLPPERMRHVRGRDIGMIFQDPLTSLNPLLTVGNQLTQTIAVHSGIGVTAARERAIGLLRDVGIPSPEQRIDSFPHEFSGGMRQRVVIALALCGNPKLVIADEPTTALDVSIQAQVLDLLRTLVRERRMGIMLVTHDMGVIAEISDRVAVMYAGRIVEIGPVRDVIKAPKHPYTIGLVGAIPRVGALDERLVQIEGSMPRLNAIPSGCAFNPRCPRVMESCRVERPRLTQVERSQVACLLYSNEGAAL